METYQEYATEMKNRKKKVLKPEDLTEVITVNVSTEGKVMGVYSTLGNCNFGYVGADITKLEILSFVVITNNYPKIMQTNVHKLRAKREVLELITKWYVSGNRKYLELSTQIVEVLEEISSSNPF